MSGITIFTAGRENAYRDYQQSVKQGHSPSVFENYISDRRIETLIDPDTDNIHLWGTSVDSKWRSVSSGDIALVYRDGRYIAQATVVGKEDNLDLAETLWRTEGNPWDPESPWRYLVFLTDVEEIDVDMEQFNELVNYQENYTPQGFTRVADSRIDSLKEQFESVENAVNELTGKGVRVHTVDDDESDEDTSSIDQSDVGQRLVKLGTQGDRAEEFEELVARGFSRLGFDARWIEGGNDTDVEITAPVHAIVEVKARSNGKLASPDAARIVSHKERNDADWAIIVAPGFTPAAVDDADRNNIILLGTDYFRQLLERRENYGISPESIAKYLIEPGSFQDDRVDQIDDEIRSRLTGTRDILAVIEALQLADPEEGTATDLRLILKGMYPDDQVPTRLVIKRSLNLLAHPSIKLAEFNDGQYQPTTTLENATVLLQQFGNLVGEVSDDG